MRCSCLSLRKNSLCTNAPVFKYHAYNLQLRKRTVSISFFQQWQNSLTVLRNWARNLFILERETDILTFNGSSHIFNQNIFLDNQEEMFSTTVTCSVQFFLSCQQSVEGLALTFCDIAFALLKKKKSGIYIARKLTCCEVSAQY